LQFETTAILSLPTYVSLDKVESSRMYVDVWSHVARRQREINHIEELSKLKLIEWSPTLKLLVTYYKVSNAILKQLLKAKVRLTALLWRVLK